MKKVLYTILKYLLTLIILIIWPIGKLEELIRKLLVRHKSTREVIQFLDSKILRENEIKIEKDTVEITLYTFLIPVRIMRYFGFIK